MRILFCGDVVGKSGRMAVKKYVPYLKNKYQISCVVINGENATHGFGVSEKHIEDFFSYGVDVITTGNHVWDRPDIIKAMERGLPVVRPYNLGKDYSGSGACSFITKDGKKVLIINMMASLFMMPCEDPFKAMAEVLAWDKVKNSGYDAVLVDFHGEACSEKYAMGHFCDGKVSLVVGTHTHTPTADSHIMPCGTGYQTDAGMCGDYHSVIGMKVENALGRFKGVTPRPRLEPAEGEGTLCGVLLNVGEDGLCQWISPVRLGGRLSSFEPENMT